MHSPLLTIVCCIVACLFWAQSTVSSDPFIEISAQATRCPAEADEPWSYTGNNGPAYWGENYPQCNGARQSPIRVDGSQAQRDENLTKLEFVHYQVPIANMTIVNTGRTVVVIPDHILGRHFVLNGTYYGLYEIHFHWGSSRSRGSEHIVNNVQYAMEMHLLHRSFQSEYAVVSVFFEQDNGVNAELQHIVNELPKVLYRGTFAFSRWYLNLINLLPENPASFYLYEGSLTTPDCSEGVKWILLKTPVSIGGNQIRDFRKLFSVGQEEAVAGCTITGNIRPIQHPHGRRVFSSE